MDDVETRLSKLEQSQLLLARDYENLSKLVDLYEQRHREDREDAKVARRNVPTWAHLILDGVLGYLALKPH